MCVCVSVLVAQLCPILCNPMDCSLPGSSVHEIFQARVCMGVDKKIIYHNQLGFLSRM